MKYTLSSLAWLMMMVSLEAAAVFDLMTSPSLEQGARVYKDRCVLCHDQSGDGNGLLPSSMLYLDKPNLLNSKYSNDKHSLRYIIVWGGMENKMRTFSPPWGNTLTWSEVESVILFIQYLREHNDLAVKLLNNVVLTSTTDIESGKIIFNRRCAICHNESGHGNGRIAKALLGPVPSDLTKSQLKDKDLKQIIRHGGKSVSRSVGMPPWESELSEAELESVVHYIKTFRHTP